MYLNNNILLYLSDAKLPIVVENLKKITRNQKLQIVYGNENINTK